MRQLAQLASALCARRLNFDLDLIPLQFERLPVHKLWNWLRTEVSVSLRPSRPWGLPTMIQVEPTSRCNLRCSICPTATGLSRHVGDMDPALFRRVVDQLGDYLLVMMFWDWGEPFLHSGAYDMIRYARRAGIKVACSTNGHVFSGGSHASEVVEAGLDVLTFSVDGSTQATYQQIRGGGRLDEVLRGIQNVAAEKLRRKTHLPVVNLRFIVTRHSEHEVPQLRDFARRLGVDVLTLRKLHFVPGTGKAAHLVPSEQRFQLPALERNSVKAVRIRRNPCRNLWNCPTIHWDGTVCSCFMDYNQRRPLGSLARQTFREIWHGEEYRRLRREFREHWQELPLCGQCASGYRGGDVGREANTEAVFFREVRT